MSSERFGQMVKRLRIAQGKTLRQFCREHGYDAGNHSKMERGVVLPPECDMILEMLARSLGLEPASDEWFTFFDTAAAERAVLPYDLAADDRLVDALPVLFGAIRMASNDGQLDKLVDLIRESLRASA